MIPVFGTAAVLLAPPAPLLSTGYVPGNPVGAQHLNWLLFHLTAEINNVLTAQGLSQNTLDDSQLLKAVGRTNVLISTSGTVTVASQFAGNTLVQFSNPSGSSNYVIGSGAARSGIELIVEALSGSGVMLVNGSGSAFLGSGAVRLLWDGSQWCKIGGNAFLRVFTSGSSWVGPWKGSYEVIVVGGGGGGGGHPASTNAPGQSGGAGATAISVLSAVQDIFNFSIGPGGPGGLGAADGAAGSASTLSVGSISIAAGGGAGGNHATGASVGGQLGGSAVGAQICINGGCSGPGFLSGAGANTGFTGNGGDSTMGAGGVGIGNPLANLSFTGQPGTGFGSGGSGSIGSGTGVASSGGSGAPGILVIKF